MSQVTPTEGSATIANFIWMPWITRKERDMALWKAMEVLSNTQFRRLILYADGMSFREIATLEGKDFSSIAESINAAKKKVRNFL